MKIIVSNWQKIYNTGLLLSFLVLNYAMFCFSYIGSRTIILLRFFFTVSDTFLLIKTRKIFNKLHFMKISCKLHVFSSIKCKILFLKEIVILFLSQKIVLNNEFLHQYRIFKSNIYKKWKRKMLELKRKEDIDQMVFIDQNNKRVILNIV